MAYSKQTWADAPATSSPLSAARLQHLEDGLAASAVVGDNACALAEQFDCVAGGLMSSYPRGMIPNFSALSAPASGTLLLQRILLIKGQSLSTIRWFGATSGGSSLVNQWFALFNSALAKLAITADDGSTAWGASANKFLTIAGGPFVVTYTGLHYVGLMVNGNCPTLAGHGLSSQSNVDGLAPFIAGTSTTGLTNTASCPSTAGAITAVAKRFYVEVG